MKTRQGTERMTNGMIALIQLGDNAPDCPACGNSNAMLNDAVEYNGIFRWGFKCRDCGFRLDEGEASIRKFSSYLEAAIAIDEGLFDADYPGAPIVISDEAIMIGNMITLWLETAYQESHASDVIALWSSPKPKGKGGMTAAARRDEAKRAQGRFSGFGWTAFVMSEMIDMTIGSRARFEIQMGISAASGNWESTSGDVI